MTTYNKRELRTLIKERFASSTDSERSGYSAQACRVLLKLDVIRNAKVILAYYPLKDEVDIRPLINDFRNDGKLILLPEVISETEMRLRVYSDSDLCSGVLGTKVPQGGVFTDYSRIDAVLVPGMAFDKEGHRLGRGKGYYDRFLAQLPQAVTIGVCFPYQLLESVPFEEHDALINHIIEY